MPTPIVRYYPSLDTLVGTSNFPDVLDFIKTEIDSILGSLYYKDLQDFRSPKGDQASFQLTIITNQQLSFEIPGTGFLLLLNPAANSDFSTFPLSVKYSWPILGYLPSFELSSFGNGPADFFSVARDALGLSDRQLISKAITVFSQDILSSSDPVAKFILDLNTQYSGVGANILTPTGDDILIELKQSIQSETGVDILTAIYQTYIDDTDPVILWERLKLFFNSLLPVDFEQFIKGIIKPQAEVEFELSGAFEVPRSILKPVDPVTYQPIPENNTNGQPDGTPRARFSFGKSLIRLDTVNGLNIDFGFSISALTPFMIGDTGIILELDTLKVDLSEAKNIPEADADGRPSNFKGVSIANASISFPSDWLSFTGGDPAGSFKLSGTNLLIGNPGGLSGQIQLDPGESLNFELLGISFIFESLEVNYKKGKITSGQVDGKLNIPGLKDSQGNEAELDYLINWHQIGFDITVSEPQGIALEIPNVVSFTLNKLTIGQKNGKWMFSVKGRIDRIKDIPMVGKAIPRYLDVKHFNFYEGQDNDFDLVFGWDGAPTINLTDDGVTGATFEKVIPINKTFLGALEVELIKFILTASGEQLKMDTTINANLAIGPLYGAVEGAGFSTIIDFPSGGGNLGPADISFDLVAPTGMAISMGAGDSEKAGFSVSGYLSYDKDKKTYKGALGIVFAEINLSAYGILALELPGGKEGFSLIIVISIEFSPAIQIGFGFSVKGVGGLLGLHRTMQTQVLRLGVKDDTLDNILFPAPPIAEKAPQILSVMDSAFPIEEDQFVFGPLALITWGSESLMSIELGVIIELDRPFRIVILGVFKLLMPAEGKELLKLQVNFLGEINFTQKYITFDASIYDSRLLSLSLMGDMLVRIFWGDNGGFLISVGGFHPLFNRPANMMLPEKITRLTISLVDTKNLKIGVEAYFAVSSNSVQVGIRGHLFVIAWEFTVEGSIGFDVLIYFKPKFRFMASIYASFSVKFKNITLLGVALEFNLEGPGPFHAFGRGEVKILGMGKSVNFDETFGQKKTTSLPSIDVGAALKEALEDFNNWESILPNRNSISVTIRKMEGMDDQVVIHPVGSLRVSQKIVPLDRVIQQFGNANPLGATLFRLKSIKVGTNAFALKAAKEQFAPAQYFKYDESQILKEASFKEYKSGAIIDLESSGDSIISDKVVSIQVAKKEEIIIDQQQLYREVFTAPVSIEMLNASFSGGSSIGHFKRTGKINENTSFDGTQIVEVVEDLYVPVDKNGNQQGSLTFDSYEAGQEWINTQLATNPMLEEDSYLIVSVDDFNSFSSI